AMHSCEWNTADAVLFYFFFFQAEDGIRDWSVTGVQTCALPISYEAEPQEEQRQHGDSDQHETAEDDEEPVAGSRGRARHGVPLRSEERRVGKEGRSRWAPYQYKKERGENRQCREEERETRVADK